MILNGNSRGHGQELARHLVNIEDNEHAVIHELRGFVADDLFGAFKETEAISLGTKCQQYLFSLSLNPPKAEDVSVEEFEAVIERIEKRLGLTDQSRAIVFHEKLGRRHAHCVWSRIDVDSMRGINLSHFKRKLTDISREIFLEKGWDMPAGLRDRKERDPLNYTHAEAGQAKRAKRDPKALKALFKACWDRSDSKAAFAAALWEEGFCLARGDRRSFVAVDASGEVYSLSRWCGIKTKGLRTRLGDGADLPTVEEAIRLETERLQLRPQDQKLQKQLNEHQEIVADLVERQREERSVLRSRQEAQRIEELKTAQARLPKGLSAAWSRLTGRYDRLVEKMEQDQRYREIHDRREMQVLIEKHLSERRALDVELEVIRARHALEVELSASDECSSGQTYEIDPRQPLIRPADDVPFTVEQLKRKPDLILSHISDKEARFTRNDVVRALSDFIDDPLNLRVAVDAAMRSPDLMPIEDGDEPIYTAREFHDLEASLSKIVSDMANAGGFKVKSSSMERAIANEDRRLNREVGANLSEEQVTAIQHVLTPNQLASVVGFAGTGKSTLLAVARDAWERQGYRVHGAALAGKAADSLETASGIKSRTLASLEASWKNGYEPIECGDILVVDEAGMVGTRQLKRVAERINQIGAKLVLVGDPDQLQPIQAGEPFRDIVEHTKAAKLTEIRRQKEDWQRQASRELAEGYVDIALKDYADHGAVQELEDRDQAIAALVNDYIADWKEHGNEKSRLALAHRRKDVHAINQAIRAAKIELEGEKEEILVHTDSGPRAFAVGDRILFTRNDRDLGVRNGMLGTVQTTEVSQLVAAVDAEGRTEGRKVTINTKRYSAVDHGYAVTIHRSQGCTVDQSYVLSSTTMDANLSYVALTRHREQTAFYSAPNIERKVSLDPALQTRQGHQQARPNPRRSL